MAKVWVRKGKPNYGNPYYNKKRNKNDSSRYSNCIRGKYLSKWTTRYRNAGFDVKLNSYAPGYDILPNCVGLASGAFNETYVNNMKKTNPSIAEKEHWKLTCAAKDFVSEAKGLGLQTLTPDKRPPLGGIVVWGKNGSNHAAYICWVSANGNEMHILQSGWGGGNGDWSTPYDPTWPPRVFVSKRSGTKGWTNGSDSPGNCTGFIVNPAIGTGVFTRDDIEEDDTLTLSGGVVSPPSGGTTPTPPSEPSPVVDTSGGVYIAGAYAHPYVYSGGKWHKTKAKVYKGKWNTTKK